MNIDPAYFGREREYVHARKLAKQLRRAVRASETGRGYALSYTARDGWQILLDDDPKLEAPSAEDDDLAEILRPPFGMSA